MSLWMILALWQCRSPDATPNTNAVFVSIDSGVSPNNSSSNEPPLSSWMEEAGETRGREK